ncbi:hypothetical protein [Streptomyces sp. Agncl-13]|uniref:hypothetical protein n=1 Tax=Streptomyces sp. Agncl-13 TaxID=3400628 RepID=UPI003A853255
MFDTALMPKYAVVRPAIAVNAEVRTPTITARSPFSCHTPKIATAVIAMLLPATASSPYRARIFSRSVSRIPLASS